MKNLFAIVLFVGAVAPNVHGLRCLLGAQTTVNGVAQSGDLAGSGLKSAQCPAGNDVCAKVIVILTSGGYTVRREEGKCFRTEATEIPELNDISMGSCGSFPIEALDLPSSVKALDPVINFCLCNTDNCNPSA